MSKKLVNVLGSTGSVGDSTASLLKFHSDKFDIGVLTAQSNVKKLAEQAISLNAKNAVIGDENLYAELKEMLLGRNIEVSAGRNALLEASSKPADITVCAIAGFAGLEPVMKATEQGGNIAIANKEPLVAAGSLVRQAAKKSGAVLLPVDSEHNAVFQVFEQENKSAIDSITLTASGGPFLKWLLSDIQKATPEQAVAHPNWSMGQKISVDSATLMNKGLEVIEAHVLFDLPDNKIKVLIHPQSTIHAFVSYSDGSVLAHLGAPDMRIPILHTLSWPDRLETNAPKLDPVTLSRLDFEEVDLEKFPALSLARAALKEGVASRIVLNAANEVAVDMFLKKKIGFMDIVNICAAQMESDVSYSQVNTLDEVIAFDSYIREKTTNYILEKHG